MSKIDNALKFSFGIIQTAYSNGNSTLFFENKLVIFLLLTFNYIIFFKGIEPLIVKTGVKYLEEAAHKFDVGVYFEANGHGTVCFSSIFTAFLNSFK